LRCVQPEECAHAFICFSSDRRGRVVFIRYFAVTNGHGSGDESRIQDDHAKGKRGNGGQEEEMLLFL
jgi:hypothetical protein